MSDDAVLGPERIELDELLEMAWDAARLGLHTSMPAVVVSYDKAAGTVKVRAPIDKLVPDGSGNLIAEPYGDLPDVPIAWPRCRAFAITMPLVAGDTGQLAICERSIAAWRAGASGHPGDAGMHTLDGSVFYPGLADEAHPPKAADDNNMIIGSETDGKGRIEILPAGGHLGAGATDSILTKTDLDNVKAAISGAAVVANDGGAALKANILAAWPLSTTTGAVWKAAR